MHRARLTLVAPVVVALAIAAAACGNDDGGNVRNMGDDCASGSASASPSGASGSGSGGCPSGSGSGSGSGAGSGSGSGGSDEVEGSQADSPLVRTGLDDGIAAADRGRPDPS